MPLYEELQSLFTKEQQEAQQRIVDALQKDPTCLDKIRIPLNSRDVVEKVDGK